MSYISLGNGKCIGDYLNPYIVAELNTSHFGDINIAKAMIDQVSLSGGDCVKFQSWSSESLYASSYYDKNPIVKRVYDKFSMSNEKLKEMSRYAASKNIDFSSTPYSIDEAKFLVEECGVGFIKIASMELNNLPYLAELARLKTPLVLSTGMGSLEEIVDAVNTIYENGNESLIILHCTSVYPSNPNIIRLKNIIGLRSEFPKCPIGYSDHSIGTEIAIASVALGACLIEKHFTLDSSRIGLDNQMASEPNELEELIRACRVVHMGMGGAGRILDSEEMAQIPKMRRSMTAASDLAAGHIVSLKDIEFKRPGNGISPNDMSLYIGKKLLVDIKSGEVMMQDFFE